MDTIGFVRAIPNFYELKQSEKCLYFAFYIIAIKKEVLFNKDLVEACFNDANIPVYTKIREYIISNSKGRSPNFIKVSNGYSINQFKLEELFKTLAIDRPIIEIENDLNKLKGEVIDANSKDFLEETIKSVEVGAYRASIIMVWILAIDHLYNYIIFCKLAEFNSKLALQTNKRIKIMKYSIKMISLIFLKLISSNYAGKPK